ncbi:LOW QUALITY PROTEIN: endogenous retrovirus group PABLB member 1 Env polyprotein-like [Gastrophryne carolinensis]
MSTDQFLAPRKAGISCQGMDMEGWLGNHGRIVPRVLKQGLYYRCINKAYSWLPMATWGNCTIERVVQAIRPRIDVMVTYFFRTPTEGNQRKRELFSQADKAWIWFPSWMGWGIELTNSKYANIMLIIETTSSIHVTYEEMAQLRKVAFQNRMALDHLLELEGGTCGIIGKECCTWIEDSTDICVQ